MLASLSAYEKAELRHGPRLWTSALRGAPDLHQGFPEFQPASNFRQRSFKGWDKLERCPGVEVRLFTPNFPYFARSPDKGITAKSLKTMARPKGFEPLTPRFVVCPNMLISLELSTNYGI